MAEVRETGAAVAGRGELHEAIRALVARAPTIETSAKNVVEIDGYRSLRPAGSDVYAAWIPGTPYHHLVSIARHLRAAGMNPVPHIAARRLPDRAAAADFLARLAGEAGVTRALVVAGDSPAAAGPFASSVELLESGLLQAHGIRSVGVAGYPEGHRALAADALHGALDRKIAYAAANGLELFVVSQFCFDGQTVLDWLAALRARGVQLPVRVGVAGPATVRTLLAYGARCGIGNSLRAIGAQAISLTRIVARHGPERLVRRLAAGEAGLGVAGLHFFPFGGFAQTAHWIDNVANGRFRLDESSGGFGLDDPQTGGKDS
ncbi:MAG: methylenetetrahydrofolate reductase [Burkholderiales bacterium]|nr:methylenetetrahydrofolate reductase [Burkholderiales bacterium]